MASKLVPETLHSLSSLIHPKKGYYSLVQKDYSSEKCMSGFESKRFKIYLNLSSFLTGKYTGAQVLCKSCFKSQEHRAWWWHEPEHPR